MITYAQNINLSTFMAVIHRYMIESILDPDVYETVLLVAPDGDPIKIHNWIMSNFPYKPDPDNGEYVIKPSKLIELLRTRTPPISTDCVSVDTPIWIKRSSNIELVELREIISSKKTTLLSGIEILTPSGFQNLIGITNKGVRRTVRVVGNTAIDITPDHKAIVNKNNHGESRYRPISECPFLSRLTVTPELDAKSNIPDDYNLGWAMGLFFTDGSCGFRKINPSNGAWWRITNSSLDFIHKAKIALDKYYSDCEFNIHTYNCDQIGSITNYGPRKESMHHLVLNLHRGDNYIKGARHSLISKFKYLFYNGRTKRLAPEILFSGKNFTLGFLEGAYAGNGSGCHISTNSKIGSVGMYYMIQKTGQVPTIHKDHNHYTVSLTGDPNKIKKGIYENDDLIPVYDITTSTGEFIAGTTGVKNCDDLALLSATFFNTIGITSRIAIADTDFNGEEDHAWAEYYEPKLKRWITFDATTRSFPVGWQYLYQNKHEIYV